MQPEQQNVMELNQSAWQMVRRYQELRLFGHKVNCPYAINFFSSHIISLMRQAGLEQEAINRVCQLYKDGYIDYGWHRGKGSPDQIESAVLQLAERHQYNLAMSQPEGVIEFMKLFGLGVDCSGFVWNVLDFAFAERYGAGSLANSLRWISADKTGVNYAGAQFWADQSKPIEVAEVQPLDLACVIHGQKCTHVALVLESDEGLQVVQSNIDMMPTGVYQIAMKVDDGKAWFDHRPSIGRAWNDYGEVLQFRRLLMIT